MNIRVNFILILCLLFGSAAILSADGSGGYAGAFLRMPVGARPGGLGNAFVSIANDANAIYFNPGGLYQIEKSAFAGMYSLMSLDRKHFQGVYITSLKKIGKVGVAANGFQVGKIDGRDSQGNPTETFDNNEFAFSLSLAKEIVPRLGVGATAKYLSHTLASQKANGFAFDFGALFKILESNDVLQSVAIGASMNNFEGIYRWDTDSELEEKIPVTMRYGGSAVFQFSKINLLASFDIINTTDEASKVAFGVESWISHLLGIRAGLYDKDINFGASFRINSIQLDYAFCPDVLEQGATSKLAIQLFFK